MPAPAAIAWRDATRALIVGEHTLLEVDAQGESWSFTLAESDVDRALSDVDWQPASTCPGGLAVGDGVALRFREAACKAAP